MLGNYRYGFNGKENDNGAKSEGNQLDYGERIYDPRLGRFLSVDLLTRPYLMLTPYQYASNTPIAAIDIDGLEATFNYPSMVSALKNYKVKMKSLRTGEERWFDTTGTIKKGYNLAVS